MITSRVGKKEEIILRQLTEKVSSILSRSGLFHRVFSRVKTEKSIQSKLALKQHYYSSNNKKLQDLFGIRVTLYFQDDEEIAISLIKKEFTEITESQSVDSTSSDKFSAQRCNFIFRIDEELADGSRLLDEELIDKSFEIQFRTVFSEGWHEVEHDLRYKCKEEWDTEIILTRQLNGILAGLETKNWAILKIFDELAYKKYKSKQWSALFRNVLRIRFEDTEFSEPVKTVFENNPSIAKELIRSDRAKLIMPLTKLTILLPLTMDTVLHTINRTVLKNGDLMQIEPPILKQILNDSFKDIHT